LWTKAADLKKLLRMPIYALDGLRPELPADGDYWIAPDAVVIGRVRLKRNASIWWGAVLRGDNDWIEVGENSNIQDLSVIHADAGEPAIIGDNVTVGHRAMIHSAIVGDGALIGMGAILLNRVRVGRDCLVGAGALLTEDKMFEDGKMILGSPARAVRDLTAEQIAGLRRSAANYVANFRRFAVKLEKL
jgi:carbonic anhydrase/acetyltransferase-like protein (isoleucine patch superfamily)